MRRAPRVARSQRGQALVECLVVALVLVPLLLLLPMIGKYQDIAHQVRAASRYVAFDAMTRSDASASGWTPEDQLATEVRRRFFGESATPIKTGDAAGDFDADQNRSWRDPRGAALIRSFDADVQVGYGAGGGATHAQGFERASDGTPFLQPQRFGVSPRGIYTASVTVRLGDLPAGLRFYEPFDRIGLVMTRSTSVAIDGWSASGPQQAEERFGGSPLVFPVGALSAVSPLVDALVTVVELPGGMSGPKLGKLEFWRDVVPQDRLQAR